MHILQFTTAFSHLYTTIVNMYELQKYDSLIGVAVLTQCDKNHLESNNYQTSC